MEKHIVIIGGGTAGCVAAGRLAREGYNISLLEKDDLPGGKVRNWFQLFPDRRKSEEIIEFLEKEINHPLIDFRKGENISGISREKGKFNISTRSTTIKGADALLIATGFDLFEAKRKEEYGYGIYPDVITSPELEEMFRKGEIRTSEGKTPGRIGIVHCVGSRDEKVGNFHCSKVCCVTAVKQAIEIKENLPDTEVICFYMDMRMFGPYYEELYRESQEKWGVQYIRGKVSETSENIEGKLVIKAEDTLAGRPIKMNVDILVLMLGMENSQSGLTLSKHLDLGIGVNRFFSIKDNHYGNNLSEIEGLFYAGTCTAPMNITDTISHARAAVTEITEYLNKN